LRGVVHCFNGSKEVAKQILDLGMYLGIGGVLTFKNCKLFETLEVVPLDRIVLETDGPYLAPTPHRGERNESRLMIFVVQRLAEIYEKTTEEIIAQTTKNARALFFA
jgi:TatD DNase family protein